MDRKELSDMHRDKKQTAFKAEKTRARRRSAILTAVSFILALLTVTVLLPAGASAADEKDVLFCDGTMQSNPRQFNSYRNVAFRFEVPEGYKLEQFFLLACPTWGDQPNSGFTADIYIWDGRYKSSVSELPFSSCRISNHKDNHRIDLSFGYVPAGQYLIVIHSFTGPIGSWEYMALPAEYVSTWAYYQDGIEETDYLPGTGIKISRDNDPKPVTVPPVTSAPTGGGDDGNEVSTPSATPLPTRERITHEAGNESSVSGKGGKGGLIAGIAVAVLLIGATAAIIAVVALKDKKAVID